jgi:hypothetical protein
LLIQLIENNIQVRFSLFVFEQLTLVIYHILLPNPNEQADDKYLCFVVKKSTVIDMSRSDFSLDGDVET